MPRGDKTGPEGNGPKTGRGMGNCVENNHPGRSTGNFGFGGGHGARTKMETGMGRRFRNRFSASVSKDNQNQDSISFLKEEILSLKDLIADLSQRISEK